jgi:hypothetical protein
MFFLELLNKDANNLLIIRFYIRFLFFRFKNCELTHKVYDSLVIIIMHLKSRLFLLYKFKYYGLLELLFLYDLSACNKYIHLITKNIFFRTAFLFLRMI